MEELIQRLDRWLGENRSDYYSQLSDGVSAADFATFEAALGVALPEDFRLFYYWKNGHSTQFYKGYFLYNYELMPIKNVLSDYGIIKETSDAGEFELANWWNDKWVPFMENGAGDYYCIDMEGSFGGEPGQILQFNHDWEVRDIKHQSFYKWLETVVIAMEQDFLPREGIDDNKYNIAYDKFKAFVKENNVCYPKRYEAG